jgi:uncharacterized protein (TIGR02231 family)
MRFSTVYVFSALGVGSGIAQAADVVASSNIDAVVVFPSGAEVTRVTKVKLAVGEQRIIFPDLPAQAVQGSIRVEGRATTKFEIGAVDTRRLAVARADQVSLDADRRKLEDQLEVLRDSRLIFEGQVQSAQAQRTLLNNLAELPKVPPGSATGPTAAVDWKAILATIGSGFGDAQKAELDGQQKIRETDRKISDLQGKLAGVAPSQEQRTEVAVFVNASTAQEADLTVRYQVPSASWTAFYDARLATGSKATTPKLDLTRRAAITQTTGEAWANVAIALSTTRPTVGASAPDLRTMTVDYVADIPPPQPIAAAPRPEMMIKRSRRGDGSEGDMAVAGAVAVPMIAEATAVNAEVVQAPFQALFNVPGRVSVPPTGETKRVQLMEEAIEPALLVRTVPKVDSKAYLYAKLILAKVSSPLLPGAVSLFRDGTFVGTGRLPFLSPGEEHELGFGADDAIRVRYTVADDKRGEKGLISSSKTDTRNYKIIVKNLHERAMAVAVFDSVPVSQQQDIRVTLTAKPSPTKSDVDDKRGVVSWESRIDPDQEQVIEFGYQVVWPSAKNITYR